MSIQAKLKAIIISCFFFPLSLSAFPSGVVVDSGTATLTTSENTTLLDADADSILDCESFNIYRNEILYINLPDTQDSIYIRITNDKPTLLRGQIYCNGSFYLLNDKGIHIDEEAQILAPEILLSGSVVSHSGLLRAEYTDSSQGGTVILTGDHITLKQHSVVNASGNTNGGKIYIGGGWRGKDPAIPNSLTTTVEENAVLFADALQNGNPGCVIVWSDTLTTFKGNISATGRGGNSAGGYAQVSSGDTLIFQGNVVLCSDSGSAGTLEK